MKLLSQFNWALPVFALLLLGAGVASARTAVTCSSPVSTQSQPTEYFVSLADYTSHRAHVTIRFTQPSRDLMLDMPAWNALYQVRDFAANVEDLHASDTSGGRVSVVKTKTSEWRMSTAGTCVVAEYDIHLDASGPFGSQLSNDHGFFNWAMVLLYSPSTRSEHMSVQLLDVPANWALRDLNIFGEAPAGKVEQAVGVAHNYDELVDSPTEVGIFQRLDFQQDGATYHIAVHTTSDYDSGKLLDTLRKITHAGVDWMSDRPFDSYTFLYHFPSGHGAGGMEHAYGTAIDINSQYLRGDMMPVAGVSAHEFFHLWNVKRIRPASLDPIDYQRAMDTRALWFSEGVTSTVGDILLSRAGLISERQYIDRVAAEISEVQLRPAHKWQSVEESSLDAWFEGNTFYRSPERSISYYNKGEIVGVLLDLRIRQLTNDTKSLRDLFHWMNDNYAKQGLPFPDSDGVQQAAETITGQSFAEFFQNYVAGVRELTYGDFFQFVGLQTAETTSRHSTPGFTTTSNIGGQPIVNFVAFESEAQRAGVNVGDKVIELNGKPVDAGLDEQISRMREGSAVKLKLASAKGEHKVKLKLFAYDEQRFILQDVPNITPEQRAHRQAWIHGDNETGGAQ